MEDNEQPRAPITEAYTPQAVERPLWELSRDEQRVLIITFVGGLASIIAGVCVVGGAIALVRGIRTIHLSLQVLIFLTTVAIFYVVKSFKQHRSLSVPHPRLSLIGWLMLLFPYAMVLLAWIGLAAGIH